MATSPPDRPLPTHGRQLRFDAGEVIAGVTGCRFHRSSQSGQDRLDGGRFIRQEGAQGHQSRFSTRPVRIQTAGRSPRGRWQVRADDVRSPERGPSSWMADCVAARASSVISSAANTRAIFTRRACCSRAARMLTRSWVRERTRRHAGRRVQYARRLGAKDWTTPGLGQPAQQIGRRAVHHLHLDRRFPRCRLIQDLGSSAVAVPRDNVRRSRADNYRAAPTTHPGTKTVASHETRVAPSTVHGSLAEDAGRDQPPR